MIILFFQKSLLYCSVLHIGYKKNFQLISHNPFPCSARIKPQPTTAGRKTTSNLNYQRLYTLIAGNTPSLLHDGYVHDWLVHRLLLRSISHVLSLQEHVDLPERRPFRRLPIPTFPHEIVNLSGAVPRL